MTDTLNFALIGCGVISHTHAKQISKIDGARLVAVADVNQHKAEALAYKYQVDVYTDYREMLLRRDIDIVSILTPSGKHGDMAIHAARAGKHVIVEKPMDISIQKAKAMIATCEAEGVKLAVISQHRFDDAVVRVKQDIASGKFGEMVLGQATVNWYRSQSYYDSGKWRGTWELDGGGALMNQSIHYIDLLQYIVGPIDSVQAHTGTLAHDIEVEDAAVAIVRFRNGAIGTIVGTTCAYPGLSARLEVFGTTGSAVITNDQLVDYYFNQHEGESSGFYNDHGKAVNLATGPTSDGTAAAAPSALGENAHRMQIMDMIVAIREDREPLVNGSEGLKSLEIVLAIYRSAQTGQSVSLPLT